MVEADGWIQEGNVGYIFTSPCSDGLEQPLYRLYNHGNGDHFYTTSLEQVQIAEASDGYDLEGIAGYVYLSQQPDSLPLYRLDDQGIHFYTTSEQEDQSVEDQPGWDGEGIQCYMASAEQ